jgi:hypothetical protein
MLSFAAAIASRTQNLQSGLVLRKLSVRLFPANSDRFDFARKPTLSNQNSQACAAGKFPTRLFPVNSGPFDFARMLHVAAKFTSASLQARAHKRALRANSRRAYFRRIPIQLI